MTFIAIAAIFTFVATKTSYYILKFFAGAAWIGVAVWYIYNPLADGASPINDILVIIGIFGGIACMFWMGWTIKKDGKEGFNFRLPAFMGGRNEDEEYAETRRMAMTGRERRENHRIRANNAVRSRRRR